MARHSSLGAFGKAFQARGAKLDKEIGRALESVALAVVTDVGGDTPILTGQAQANWLTNIGSEFPYYIWNEDDNRAVRDSIDWANKVLQKVKSTDVIHITNNLPYIVQLNRGTSRQAPALFVQSALLRASYSLRNFKISWT